MRPAHSQSLSGARPCRFHFSGKRVYQDSTKEISGRSELHVASELRNDRSCLSVPNLELRRRRFTNGESTIDISLLVPTRLCSWPFGARKRLRCFHSHHVSCCTVLHWQSYS